MIPNKIKHEHIIKAIKEIDLKGVPSGRGSRKFALILGRKRYPPKYILSLANRYISAKELNPSTFSGGEETNSFLRGLGFVVRETNVYRYLLK